MELEQVRQQLLAAGYDVTRLKRELDIKEREFHYLQGVFDALAPQRAKDDPEQKGQAPRDLV